MGSYTLKVIAATITGMAVWSYLPSGWVLGFITGILSVLGLFSFFIGANLIVLFSEYFRSAYRSEHFFPLIFDAIVTRNKAKKEGEIISGFTFGGGKIIPRDDEFPQSGSNEDSQPKELDDSFLDDEIVVPETNETPNNENLNKQFLEAAKEGNIDDMETLVLQGVNVNYANESGMTALMYASKYGKLEAAKFLAHHEVDVDYQDKRGMTAMMYASRNGHFDIVKILVSKDATVHLRNNRNESAVYLAKSSGHHAITEFLRNEYW